LNPDRVAPVSALDHTISPLCSSVFSSVKKKKREREREIITVPSTWGMRRTKRINI